MQEYGFVMQCVVVKSICGELILQIRLLIKQSCKYSGLQMLVSQQVIHYYT